MKKRERDKFGKRGEKVCMPATDLYKIYLNFVLSKKKIVFLSLDISARYVEIPILIYRKKTGYNLPTVYCGVTSCVHITVDE
jgi:hypothetical protein